MTTVREILVATRELLSDPTRWTTGAVAKRADGQIVDTGDPAACCFCTVGGLQKSVLDAKAEGNMVIQCWDELSETSNKMFPSTSDHGNPTDPIDVNDWRGHAETLRMFDLTIERLPA